MAEHNKKEVSFCQCNAIYKLSTEMLSFSEKHESKHVKVQGKFSATPLTVLQI